MIGPNGVIFTENGGTLFALGAPHDVKIELNSSNPDLRTGVVGESLTFSALIINTGCGVNPTGTVTFQDFTYQDVNPITTPLGTFTVRAGKFQSPLPL